MTGSSASSETETKKTQQGRNKVTPVLQHRDPGLNALADFDIE